MTAIAQGIKKQTVFKKQASLGTPSAGAGGQILRRRTSVFQAIRDTFASDEIVSHHQSTGVAYGLKRVQGKLDGLLSAGTYQAMFEAILEKLAAATAPMTIGTDCVSTAVGSVGGATFADGSSGYITAGLKVGDVGQFTGFTTTATGNNSRNFWITALTAGLMTGVFLDGAIAYSKTETGSVTFTVGGKKIVVPTTGHTLDYLTFEEWYSDISKSELFTDCVVGQISLSLPATGNCGISVDIIGLARALAGAQVLTTPTAETQTGILTASNGKVYVNGAAAATATGVTVQITGNAQNAGAVIGSNSAPDVSRGKISVSGSFTAQFDASTIQALYDAETNIGLNFVVVEDQTATSRFVGVNMSKIKITSDQPDDGEKAIMRTYNFTAQINDAGGAATAYDNSIFSIQDSSFA